MGQKMDKDFLDAIDEPVQEWAQTRDGYPLTNGASVRSKLNFRKIAEVTQQMILDEAQDIVDSTTYTMSQKTNAQKVIQLLNEQVIDLKEAGQYLADIVSQHQPEFPKEENRPAPSANPSHKDLIDTEMTPLADDDEEDFDDNPKYSAEDKVWEAAVDGIYSRLASTEGINNVSFGEDGDKADIAFSFSTKQGYFGAILAIGVVQNPRGYFDVGLHFSASSYTSDIHPKPKQTVYLVGKNGWDSPEENKDDSGWVVDEFILKAIKELDSTSAASFVNFKKLSLVDTKRLEAPVSELKPPKTKAVPGDKGGLEKKNEAPKLS